MPKRITEEDYKWAAKELGCEVAAIKAVDEVESYGDGFNQDGSPVILFEGHKFHKYTGGKYSVKDEYKNISYPRWTRKWYSRGATKEIRQQGEYNRFKKAVELDKEAAIKSTSFGRYQIMGFNYEMVGFDDIYNFYFAMGRNEFEHLKAFVEYCKSANMVPDLRDKYWRGVARKYNGSSYEANGYHTKLEKAYNKYRDA